MVRSMTGFARMQNEGEWGTVVWEIKAVNGRYLDMCFRLPEVFHELEPVLREKSNNKYRVAVWNVQPVIRHPSQAMRRCR